VYKVGIGMEILKDLAHR